MSEQPLATQEDLARDSVMNAFGNPDHLDLTRETAIRPEVFEEMVADSQVFDHGALHVDGINMESDTSFDIKRGLEHDPLILIPRVLSRLVYERDVRIRENNPS